MTWRLCFKSRVDINPSFLSLALYLIWASVSNVRLQLWVFNAAQCFGCQGMKSIMFWCSWLSIDVASKSLFILRNCQHDRDCWHLPQPQSPWRGWSWSCIVCLAAGSGACVSIEITLGNLCRVLAPCKYRVTWCQVYGLVRITETFIHRQDPEHS